MWNLNSDINESLKSIFSLILFAYNFMIEYFKKKKPEKIIRESAFNKKKTKPGLKFNPGLALTGVWTVGPWVDVT